MASKVEIDSAWLDELQAAFKSVVEGDYGVQLKWSTDDPQLAACAEQVNGALASVQAVMDEQHERSMELAMGLSESFGVLAEVRRGNLEAEVSEATLTSSEEMIAQLGATLNDTVRELREQMETIERQQFAIRELSTPVLQLWDDVLAMPIIGMVDTRRSAEIMERLLAEVVDHQARFVILDITGVDIVDTRTADYFIKVIKAAELLGTQCLLTGIQPAVAQTLVELGVDLTGIRTLRNLKAGLRECQRQMAGTAAGTASSVNELPGD